MKDSTQVEQPALDNREEEDVAYIREWNPDTDSLSNFIIKPMDAEELLAGEGLEPYAALQKSIDESDIVWVIDFGGTLCAIFGLNADKKHQAGIAWFIGSPEIDSLNSIGVARATKMVVGEMETFFPLLHNYILADYSQAVKWVKFLGFNVSDETYILHDPNKPFYYMWRYSE